MDTGKLASHDEPFSPVTRYDAGLAIKLLLIKSSEHKVESSNPHNQENVNQKNLSVVSDTPSLAPHWKATSGVCLQMKHDEDILCETL